MKLSTLSSSSKGIIPIEHHAIEICTLDELMEFSRKLNPEVSLSFLTNIASDTHEDLDKQFQKLSFLALDNIYDAMPVGKRIEHVLRHQILKRNRARYLTAPSWWKWLDNRLESEFEKLTVTITSQKEMNDFLNDPVFTHNFKQKLLCFLVENPKNDKFCILGAYMIRGGMLEYYNLEGKFSVLREFLSHENPLLLEAANHELLNVIKALEQALKNKQAYVAQGRTPLDILFEISSYITEPTARTHAIVSLQAKILSMNDGERLPWLLKLSKDKSEMLSHWATLRLKIEVENLSKRITNLSKLNIFLNHFDEGTQLELLVVFLRILEVSKNSDRFKYLKKVFRAEFKDRIDNLYFGEKIDLLLSVVDLKRNEAFHQFVIDALKNEIEEISAPIDRIRRLIGLQEHADPFLFSWAVDRVDQELQLLKSDDRVTTLRAMISALKDKHDLNKKDLADYYEILLRKELNQVGDSIKQARMLIEQILEYTAEPTSDHLKDLKVSIEALAPKEQALLFDELDPNEFPTLGKNVSLALLLGKLQGMDSVRKLKILLGVVSTNAFLCVQKDPSKKKEYFINQLLKEIFSETTNNIQSLKDLTKFLESFSKKESIKLLERLAGYQENQPLRKLAYQALGQEISDFEEKIKRFDRKNVDNMREIVDSALDVLTIDVCSKQDQARKATALKNAAQVISQYFEVEEHATPEKLSIILKALARDNVKSMYDANWQLQDKNEIFGTVVTGLLLKVENHLKKDSEFSWETISNIFSVFELSNVAGIGACYRPPNEAFIEMILKKAEALISKNTPFTAQQAFQIISGLLDSGLKKGISSPEQATLLVDLTNKAMDLMKSNPFGPFRMFKNYETKRASRASDLGRLLRTLPQAPINSAIFHSLIQKKQKEKANNIMTVEEMNEIMRLSRQSTDNRITDLLSQLYNIEPSGFRGGFFRELAYGSSSRYGSSEHRREDGKTRWDLSTQKDVIQLMHADNNPRGLNIALKAWSAQIVWVLKSGSIAYYAEDITEYLKSLRHHVIDITDPDVQSSISRLCKEAVSEMGIKEVTPKMALDLLWINMVLAINAKVESVPYTAAEQAVLFEKIKDLKIDPTQARQLFEIRTMQWHGSISFDAQENLITQMNGYFNKSFKGQGTNTYPFEKICYDEIKKYLKNPNIELQLNITCPHSVREIDLAYEFNEVKIAINVDGSPHFDPITEEQNMNTVFRNALLEKAGWRIFDINLVGLDANSNLGPLEAECRRIAEEINKIAPAAPVVAQSETSTIISQPTLPLKQVAQTRPKMLQSKPVTTQNGPVGTHSQPISHPAKVAPVTFSSAAKKVSNAKAVQSQSKSVASGHPHHFKAIAATHPSSAAKH